MSMPWRVQEPRRLWAAHPIHLCWPACRGDSISHFQHPFSGHLEQWLPNFTRQRNPGAPNQGTSLRGQEAVHIFTSISPCRWPGSTELEKSELVLQVLGPMPCSWASNPTGIVWS